MVSFRYNFNGMLTNRKNRYVIGRSDVTNRNGETYLCELSFLTFGVTGVNALPLGENPVVAPPGIVSGPDWSRAVWGPRTVVLDVPDAPGSTADWLLIARKIFSF